MCGGMRRAQPLSRQAPPATRVTGVSSPATRICSRRHPVVQAARPSRFPCAAAAWCRRGEHRRLSFSTLDSRQSARNAACGVKLLAASLLRGITSFPRESSRLRPGSAAPAPSARAAAAVATSPPPSAYRRRPFKGVRNERRSSPPPPSPPVGRRRCCLLTPAAAAAAYVPLPPPHYTLFVAIGSTVCSTVGTWLMRARVGGRPAPHWCGSSEGRDRSAAASPATTSRRKCGYGACWPRTAGGSGTRMPDAAVSRVSASACLMRLSRVCRHPHA